MSGSQVSEVGNRLDSASWTIGSSAYKAIASIGHQSHENPDDDQGWIIREVGCQRTGGAGSVEGDGPVLGNKGFYISCSIDFIGRQGRQPMRATARLEWAALVGRGSLSEA